jgi:hypothetical protein
MKSPSSVPEMPGGVTVAVTIPLTIRALALVSRSTGL